MGIIVGLKHIDAYINKRNCIICGRKIHDIGKADFDDRIGVWFCEHCKKLFLTLCDNCKKIIMQNDTYYVLKDDEFKLAKRIFCSECIEKIN